MNIYSRPWGKLSSGETATLFTLVNDNGMTLEITDLWTGEEVKSFNGTIEIQSLEPHACRLFRVKIIDK